MSDKTMTVQEAVKQVSAEMESIDLVRFSQGDKLALTPALTIVLRAAEENEKNAEDAEKWRAVEWVMETDSDAVRVAFIQHPWEYIDEILDIYREAQVEAEKKEAQ